MLADVYPQFLDCGYTSDLFWESSLQEILDMLDSKRRQIEAKAIQKLEETKVTAIMNHALAEQVAEMVSLMMSADTTQEPLPLSKYFPVLFIDEEREEHERVKNELELNKAKMEEFAYWHNQKRRKEGK